MYIPQQFYWKRNQNKRDISYTVGSLSFYVQRRVEYCHFLHCKTLQIHLLMRFVENNEVSNLLDANCSIILSPAHLTTPTKEFGLYKPFRRKAYT